MKEITIFFDDDLSENDWEALVAEKGSDEEKGGPGSGHWGHVGRPGKIGGSIRGALSLLHGPTSEIRRQIAKAPMRDLAEIAPGHMGESHGVLITSPYNETFVSQIKAGVPAAERGWDSENRRWFVSDAYADKAQKIASQNYHVFENIGPQEARRERLATILKEVRIRRAKSYQQSVSQNRARFEREIESLTDLLEMGGLSRRREAETARQRNLYSYTLRDLATKPERLTDLQISGIAAALREIGVQA